MRYAENSFCNGKKLMSILLLILTLCGVVCGIWLMLSHADWEYLHTNIITQGFTEDGSRKTLLDVFFNSLSWTSYTLILVYLCGYSAIAHPICLFLLFMRGVALGVSTATMYVEYGSKGILIFLLMVMLHAIISSMVLVFAVIQSLTQSTMIACNIFGRSSDLIRIQKYNLKFLLYAIIIILSSIIDTILTYLLTNRLLV